MLIGIISDTHDRHPRVERAVEVLKAKGVSCVLHCGDIESPETVRLFEGLTTHFVFGNNDWDKAGLRAAMAAIGATIQEPFGHLELNGKKLAWIHGDDTRELRALIHSGHFDYVFHGHTHHAQVRQHDKTVVVNPGALHRITVKQFMLLDLDNDGLETVVVE